MKFVGQADPTLGCEWELQLVRENSLELADGILALMGKLDENALIKPEYLQCCVEFNTPPCHDAAAIETALNRVLLKVIDSARPLGVQLAAAGTHPFDRKLAIVTPSPRYLRMAQAHGMMPVHPVTFATHVHVACVDGDSAIRAMRRLTPCLPVLLALGSNSPFWHGLDTGYACFRQRLLASNPTYGLPPYFESWDEFNHMLSAARLSRTVESFRDLHWDIRPHGDLGTLELRVFDAQIDAHRVAQIAAFTRALVVLAAARETDDSAFVSRLPHWMELENHFRASKFGLAADLIVSDAGDTESALGIVERLFSVVRPVAERLGDSLLVATLERTLIDGNGAVRQRRQWEQHHSGNDVAGFLVRSLQSTH